MREGKGIKIIEWDDLNKKKFYANSLALATSMRTCVYPLNLVKTRLQVTEKSQVYNGVRDAFKKIYKVEGIRGLYRGFPISMLHVVAGQLYLTSYELSKQFLFKNQRTSVQHMCAGFTASLVSQTVMVPVDIISQHQQMLRSFPSNCSGPSGMNFRRGYFGQSMQIGQNIIRSEGIVGLYRGYLISLLTYGSNSGLYWLFYYLYSEFTEGLIPTNDHVLREPFRIGLSGLSASISACIITNPLDVVRTRLQLQRKSESEKIRSLDVFRNLVKTDGYLGLTRGLYARMTQSSFTSIFIILGYEYIKKLSVKDEIKIANDLDGL